MFPFRSLRPFFLIVKKKNYLAITMEQVHTRYPGNWTTGFPAFGRSSSPLIGHVTDNTTMTLTTTTHSHNRLVTHVHRVQYKEGLRCYVCVDNALSSSNAALLTDTPG